MALFEEEKTEMKGFTGSINFMTNVYGFVSVALRLTIITGSTIASAEALKGIFAQKYPWLLPTLTVTVAIAASLEGWLKPRDKWRGFMAVRDTMASDIFLKFRNDNVGGPEREALYERFLRVQEQHRKDNVF